MKLSYRFLITNIFIIILAITVTSSLCLYEMQKEFRQKAFNDMEVRLKIFHALLGEKGKVAHVSDGRLMFGEYVVNNNFELPDQIKTVFGGVATIFMGDTRVSTNVLKPDGSRAVGTKLQGDVHDAVINEGKAYRGWAQILQVPYFTAYDPIFNESGEVIGALYVGEKQSEYLAVYDRLKYLVACIGIVLASLLSFISFLTVKKQILDLARKNHKLRLSESNLKNLYKELDANYIATVRALANSIEAKDAYTKGHCERVTSYSVDIGLAMGMDRLEIRDLEFAAMLHDIGKIGVPGEVLNKNRILNIDEFPLMQRHPEIGYSILDGVEFLENSRKIILQHHEHADGSGYPNGITGDRILLAARILSVADAFDAMTSQRSYRKVPLTLDEAVTELRKYAGTHFDCTVVETAIITLEIRTP